MAAIRNFPYKSAEEANRKALNKRKVLSYNPEAVDAQARKEESKQNAILARKIELNKTVTKVTIIKTV